MPRKDEEYEMKDNDIAIRVENISKCYRLGVKEEQADNLLATMGNFIKNPFTNYKKYRSLYRFDDFDPLSEDNPPDILWALKDVSFEVKEGEIVGIIGVNGAGKSTLLKILSKITVPTGGRAMIRGRVSSLLEVGTGFHPELTGRENAYLNGTILGMSKKEIDRKFDQIVDFSGIEKYIDTPVKRYSSGMKVRLAFAVAAHLEPEILIIDEVLAVGDASFQKKCMDKMKDVGQQGRTVLFVSHNMPAVTRLCPRTILLNGGIVQIDDVSHRVVSAYMKAGMDSKAERLWYDGETAPGDEVIRLCSVRVKTKEGKVTDTIDIQSPVGLEMEYEVLQPGYELQVYYHVIFEGGVEAFEPIDNDPIWRNKSRPMGRYVSTAWIPGNFLSEGMYFIGPTIRTRNPELRRIRVDDAVAFQVIDNLDGNSARVDYMGNLGGVVRPLLKWETQYTLTGDHVLGETIAREGSR